MGSGLILLLIVGAWLAVLVPVALRSHEASSALATVDKFSDAMRVLSRRGRPRSAGASPAAGDGAPDPSPGAPVDDAAPRSVRLPRPSHFARWCSPSSWLRLGRRSRRRPRRHLTPAARRLRVLIALVVLAVTTLAGAVFGSLWLLVPHAVADLLLVGFVCWLRARAVAQEEQEWRRAMGEPRPVPAASRAAGSAAGPYGSAASSPGAAADARPVEGASAARATATRGALPAVVAPVRVAGVPDRMPSRAQVAGAPERLVVVPPQDPAARVRGAQGEPWQPVPVPLPTYVSAARAPRRVVDLDRSAPAAALSSADRSVGIADHGPELDHILDRRAVGD